jgi:nucleotide-binding universal stress UspA family protein
MRILIGYDGSSCSEAALDDLDQAGLPESAEVQIISVADVWMPPEDLTEQEIISKAGSVHTASDLKTVYTTESQAVKEAMQNAEKAKSRVRSMFPEWRVSTVATYGSAATEILKLANSWKPSLIVLGSHGHGVLGRLFLGSVSNKVVKESPCSVRVARGRVEVEKGPSRTIIGVDGSKESNAAIRHVLRRNWRAGSRFKVIAVEQPANLSIASIAPPLALLEQINSYGEIWMKRMVEHAADLLKEGGLQVESTLLTGDPTSVLLEEAERWRADTIFLGSTGITNRFGKLLLGSVSESVVNRAHCSVEIVRE